MVGSGSGKRRKSLRNRGSSPEGRLQSAGLRDSATFAVKLRLDRRE